MGHEVTGLVCPLSGVAILSEMTGFKHHDLNAGLFDLPLDFFSFRHFDALRPAVGAENAMQLGCGSRTEIDVRGVLP